MTDHRTPTRQWLNSIPFWVSLVFAVSLISRLAILVFYQPVAFSDTPSYRRLASAVLGGFAKYDGTRTPGYPVFLALVGSDQRVWFIQLLLGFITTFLLFYIAWKFTGKAWFGGLIALAHTLNLGQLFFESNLLTESLTTFLLIASLVGMSVWLFYPPQRSLWLAFITGLASVLTLLVRPLFIFLPFLLLVFLWIGLKRGFPSSNGNEVTGEMISQSRSWVNQHPSIDSISFILPVALLLGSWVSFIHKNYGDWSLTTMTGYHLIQHTGSFFEYVPDEYATLRDTYIQYRNAHITEYGTQTNTIWEAIPEMSRLSGYNFYDLSRVLAKLSVQLILKHPWLFVKSAISGWWMFWRTSFYWSADAFRFAWLATAFSFVILVQRVLLFGINLIFIFSSLFYAIHACLVKVRHKQFRDRLSFTHPAKNAFFWLLWATIWIASILQTLLDHGDNPRFLIPLQSLVVLWVALFFLQLFFTRRATKNSAAEQ